MPEFRLTPNPQVSYLLHGRFDISAPGGVALKDELKSIPGVKYYINDWNVKSWLVPAEMKEATEKLARKHGFFLNPADSPTGYNAPTQPPEVTLFNDLGKFSPFQKPDIERLLQGVRDHQAWLVAYAMGLGKTPVAIESMRHLEVLDWVRGGSQVPAPPFDVLIICPAMAREVWLHGNGPEFKDNGFARWWPGRFSRSIHRGREYPVEPFSVTSTDNGPRSLQRWVSQANEAGDSGRGKAVVCSYGILRSLLEALGTSSHTIFSPRAIILDEAHYISNPKSAQSKAVFDAREMFPEAYRIALTGTPLTNPDDLAGLHTVLDWLWPERFGTLGAFRWRYMNPEQVYSKAGDFKGHKYQGLNETYAPELRQRLASVASRLTKKDVAHLLPPFACSLVPFDGDRRGSACDLAVSLLQQGHEHVRIACYFHETADALVKALNKSGRGSNRTSLGYEVFQVDGRQTPEVRAATLAQARTSKKSITVATISSTKVAIDLTFQTASVYAELTHKIEEILQNLGRGHRASSVRGHDVFILADESGDALATGLYRKATILADILQAGTEEQALIDTIGTLKEKGMTQEEIDDMLSMVRLGDDE